MAKLSHHWERSMAKTYKFKKLPIAGEILAR